MWLKRSMVRAVNGNGGYHIMDALSTQGYRGTRDLYPEDLVLRTYLLEKIRTTLHDFCYQEYDGPFLEPLELYAAKSSQEIVNEQLYQLTDKGNRRLAIRPEMTPTLARMIAAKGAQLPKPLRWYSLPTCMRFERPQRGRLREFLQLNVDALGGSRTDEDVEIVQVACALLEGLGAEPSDFQVRVNHRGVMNLVFQQVLHLTNEAASEIMRLIDRKSKMEPEAFWEGCAQAGLTLSQQNQLKALLSDDGWSFVSHALPPETCPEVAEFNQTLVLLQQLTPTGSVVFSPEIMRGFDYYTGIIFEIFDTHPENRRALMGGGRYDNLVASFGAPALSGVGFGVSDVSFINFLNVRNLLPCTEPSVDVTVVRFNDDERTLAFALAKALRKAGLRVQNYTSGGKFGKQIAAAQRQGAKAVAFRGGEEQEQNSFCVKILSTGEQKSYPFTAAGFKSFKENL